MEIPRPSLIAGGLGGESLPTHIRPFLEISGNFPCTWSSWHKTHSNYALQRIDRKPIAKS